MVCAGVVILPGLKYVFIVSSVAMVLVQLGHKDWSWKNGWERAADVDIIVVHLLPMPPRSNGTWESYLRFSGPAAGASSEGEGEARPHFCRPLLCKLHTCYLRSRRAWLPLSRQGKCCLQAGSKGGGLFSCLHVVAMSPVSWRHSQSSAVLNMTHVYYST
jgi:hypothetical protein